MSCWVLLGITVLAGSAPAWAEELRPVLLPVQGDHSIRSLTDEIEQACTQFGTKVQRSRLPLEDLMLAVGCKTTSIACLQDIGQSIKASVLIISTARRVPGGVKLSLRWFDVKSGGDLGEFARVLPADAIERQKILERAIRDLHTRPPASKPEQAGGLSISASVPFVEIILDGQPRGTVPLELRNLKAGSYTVVAQREGYLTTQRTVEVKPDQMSQLQFDMTPAPYQPRRAGFLESIRGSTWIVGGAGLAFIAVGAAFAAHLKAQQDHLNATQGITFAEIQQMQDYKDTGQRDATVANVMFGLGSATLVAAVVLSYLDYRRGRTVESASPSLSSAVRVGPASVSVQLGF